MEKNEAKLILETQKGFSLAEILVALTILAIAGAFVGSKVYERLTEGKINSAKIQMQNLGSALSEFRRHCGFYPTSDQGLEALVSKPSGRDCKRYAPGGYLEKEVPKDPWDNDYIYTSDGNSFNIISLGNDNAEGGEGENADIPLHTGKSSGGGATVPAPADAEAPQQ